MKHFKYIFYLTTPKNTGAVTSTQKIHILEIQYPKIYSADSCLLNMPDPPPGVDQRVKFAWIMGMGKVVRMGMWLTENAHRFAQFT